MQASVLVESCLGEMCSFGGRDWSPDSHIQLLVKSSQSCNNFPKSKWCFVDWLLKMPRHAALSPLIHLKFYHSVSLYSQKWCVSLIWRWVFSKSRMSACCCSLGQCVGDGAGWGCWQLTTSLQNYSPFKMPHIHSSFFLTCVRVGFYSFHHCQFEASACASSGSSSKAQKRVQIKARDAVPSPANICPRWHSGVTFRSKSGQHPNRQSLSPGDLMQLAITWNDSTDNPPLLQPSIELGWAKRYEWTLKNLSNCMPDVAVQPMQCNSRTLVWAYNSPTILALRAHFLPESNRLIPCFSCFSQTQVLRLIWQTEENTHTHSRHSLQACMEVKTFHWSANPFKDKVIHLKSALI